MRVATYLQKTKLTAMRQLAQDYEWFHTVLGLLGNLMFFVGSVLFLFEPAKVVGIWMFIVGSFGMLVNSLGSAVVKDSAEA